MAKENAFSPKPQHRSASGLSATVFVKVGGKETMEKLNNIFK